MLSFIKDKKTYFFLTLLISIGIALQISIYKIASMALLFQWLINTDHNQKILKLKQNNIAVGLIGFFCLYAISFFWSDNQAVSVTDTILKLPLLIFPLIILSQKRFSVKKLNQVFLVFAFSSLLINLFCFTDAYLNFIKTNQTSEFYYSNLTMNIHTAYQSMFTCFSIVIFVYLFVKEKFISNWTSYFTVAVQMVFILLLSSRMQILIMMVLVPVYFISFYYKRKQFLLGLLYTGLIFGFSYLIIEAPSSLNYRYNQTVSQISSIGVDNDNSDPRKMIWAEGLEVIKKNWFFGAGNGDAKGALLEKYSQSIVDDFTAENLVDSTVFQIKKNKKAVFHVKEKAVNNNVTYEEQLRHYAKYLLERKYKKYKVYFKKGYNFHNQYLQTFGEIGVVGFLLLCFLLIYPFILSIKNKDYLAISFLFIVAASFLTESMLERQAGVAFFSFFYVLLISRLTQNKS